jgi:hypothetical protein
MAKLTRYRQIFDTNDEQTAQLQSGVVGALNQLQASPLTGAQLITGVIIIAGTPTIVPHGLNKVPTGYLVVSANAASSTWLGTSPAPASVLSLQASATVTVNILVF